MCVKFCFFSASRRSLLFTHGCDDVKKNIFGYKTTTTKKNIIIIEDKKSKSNKKKLPYQSVLRKLI
jgi:hypothetical protein